MTRRTRLVAVMMLALPLLALGAAPARAHPFGVKPVLFLAATHEGVNVRWVAQPDEFRALAEHLRLGPVSPAAMAERAKFKAYFLERLAIATTQGSCEGAVLGATEVTEGFVVAATYVCPERPDEVTVQMRMLQDVDDRYVTLLHASTDVEPVRAAFTSSVDEIEIDFRTAESVASRAVEDRDEGSADRIIAALQGVDGSTSMMLAIGLAFVLGLLHGITPGHGKTIAAAYLVGAGGTKRQALALGGIVTLTHAASTGLIAAVPIALGETQPPRGLSSWLEVVAGVLIVGFGLMLVRRPAHDHDHHHVDEAGRAFPLRRLAGIGFVGGLVPNPEALLVVLVAFSLQRWTAGAALIGAFSVGLGIVVLGIAMAAVKGSAHLRRLGGGRFVALAPRIAAAIFVVMGVVVVARGAVSL